MFKIVRFPSMLEPFFSSLTTEFHWNHFAYFRWLVLLVAFSWGRRNISSLYRQLDRRAHHHRTRFNNFLLLDRWDPEQALRDKALELLGALKPKPGDVVQLILDDSKKQKRGKHMDAVGWLHDPTTGRNMRGHQYVKATLLFRGQRIPWGIRLYVKKEHAAGLKVAFQKTTELAAELIRSFQAPAGVKVRVLFDSYYLCPAVVEACREKGFRFVSTLKSNRNLFKHGRKLKAGQYGRSLFRRGQAVRVSLNKGRGRYSYVDAGWLELSGLGALHVVFTRKNGRPGTLGLVTDDPALKPKGLLLTYEKRWNIEVFFKDAKQLLGLGQYQNGSYRAAVNHLHLVCFAYALLTHLAITGSGEKGKRAQAHAAKTSTEGLQNELRRIVWNDLAAYLKELRDGDSVVKELDRLLLAA